MDEISVLQLGNENWSIKYVLPEGIRFEHADMFVEPPKKPYDIVFLDRELADEELDALYWAISAHTLFVTDRVDIRGKMQWLYSCKKGQRIATGDIQNFLLQEVKYFYPKPYGEKFRLMNMAIAQGFSGFVKWNGGYNVTLRGKYGEDFCQIAYWRYNIPVFQGQTIDFWLEYYKESSLEISLAITEFPWGSVSEVVDYWEFSEKELENIVQVENKVKKGWLFISLRARGRGELRVIALHDRYSRGRHGYFLPGGERYVTSDREEIFCYFDPGDRKPPLNVYFSGYKTRQGFEGYNMMRNMGCPFLLIAEPRLDGGSFYMGSMEYEELMVDIINRYMTELGFVSDQVIMSGVSMGTSGALYYGCDIKPHAMILGKPLASIGNVARHEKHLRPEGFPTSLNVLLYLYGDTDAGAVDRLNRRFWEKFDKVDWGKSKFIVSYMIEDDYDPGAYDVLISRLRSGGVQVYGRGIHGRHNDNTSAIVSWFASQYEKILREDFKRGIEK